MKEQQNKSTSFTKAIIEQLAIMKNKPNQITIL